MDDTRYTLEGHVTPEALWRYLTDPEAQLETTDEPPEKAPKGSRQKDRQRDGDFSLSAVRKAWPYRAASCHPSKVPEVPPRSEKHKKALSRLPQDRTERTGGQSGHRICPSCKG